MTDLRPNSARFARFASARTSALRPLAILFLSSAFAFACGDSNDDDDKGSTPSNNTTTPGAMTGSSPSTASDAGAANPLDGLAGLLADASFDPSQICAMNPELCKDGMPDLGAAAGAACQAIPALCADAGAGGIIGGLFSGDGGFLGGLGGLGGGGRTGGGASDAGAGSGATDAGTSTADASGDAH